MRDAWGVKRALKGCEEPKCSVAGRWEGKNKGMRRSRSGYDLWKHWGIWEDCWSWECKVLDWNMKLGPTLGQIQRLKSTLAH